MEGGTQCWNGPVRSVVVSVSCGSENQLLRASEPNRCEYAFDFNTPAACVFNSAAIPNNNINESTDHEHEQQHTEL